MANEFLRVHVAQATLTLVSTSTVNSQVKIPAGAIILAVSTFNNQLLVGAGNITVVVDTVAVTATEAAVLTDANLARHVLSPALGANAGNKTVVATNGGLIGVTTSTNTVGSVTVTVTYIL